jgi:hypothetical protein
MIAQGSLTIDIDTRRHELKFLIDRHRLQIIQLSEELKTLQYEHNKSIEDYLELASLLEELQSEYYPPTSQRG